MDQMLERTELLSRLTEAVCKDFHVNLEAFQSRFARGRTATARHVFVLVALECGYSPQEIEKFMKMGQSFVAQVQRRNYRLKQTVEYHHAIGLMKGWEVNGEKNGTRT